MEKPDELGRFPIFHLPFTMQDAFFSILLEAGVSSPAGGYNLADAPNDARSAGQLRSRDPGLWRAYRHTPLAPRHGSRAPPSMPLDVSPAVRAMLEALPSLILSEIDRNRELLARNPNSAAQINAKIALLQKPTLVHEIFDGRFFIEEEVTSMNGRYIGNESLTQFLELYVYNTLRGAASDIATWQLQRDCGAMGNSNKDLCAVMDVYRLMGHDPMSRAYAGVVPLRPPYGEPLSPAAIQAFVDRAPVALKAQVEQKLAKVTF